jgi:lysophospholipase L1-like esterase
VFIGSSQLLEWKFSDTFPNRNFVKKAVSSDTVDLMLARFQTDVVALKPKVVVIWAGENDIQRAVPLEEIQKNVMAMSDQALQANIRVVLCTLAPKAGPSSVQNPTIVQFNAWLRDFGANPKVTADFYQVLADASGNLRPEFAHGDQHFTAEAYVALTPVAVSAIEQVEQK